MTTMTTMTLTAYAKLRGVSTMAVSKAISTGRLSACVARDRAGRPSITDAELANQEWEASRRAPSLAARRAAHGMSPSSEEERSETLARALDDLLPGQVPALATSVAIKEAAAARREVARAEMAELEVAKRRGQMMSKEQALRDIDDDYTLVRNLLLGVSSRFAQRLPQYAAAVVPVLDALIREALEELAGSETKETT